MQRDALLSMKHYSHGLSNDSACDLEFSLQKLRNFYLALLHKNISKNISKIKTTLPNGTMLVSFLL